VAWGTGVDSSDSGVDWAGEDCSGDFCGAGEGVAWSAGVDSLDSGVDWVGEDCSGDFCGAGDGVGGVDSGVTLADTEGLVGDVGEGVS